ncbi:uncharacterized protein LOC100899870 [Galendromus occidentalis]|uniref:Uncharacterized protein LOC100899870 n=1 Tax=Galendromus occidentalis TaxID=34638 RepID=A0AAJ7L686_9ACAR|nr:uncharacterized protein LOC100899870 [Galendromus occidentalis]
MEINPETADVLRMVAVPQSTSLQCDLDETSLADKLRSFYMELLVMKGFLNVEIGEFCRYVLDRLRRDSEGRGNYPSYSGNEVMFLKTVLETFVVETCDGVSYISVAPAHEENRPGAPFSPTRPHSMFGDRLGTALRRRKRQRLLGDTDLEVRVTDSFFEGKFIRIKFFPNQSVIKLCRINRQLNSGELGGCAPSIRGSICAAPYLDTGFYLRVMVEKVMKDHRTDVKVHYVDFGYREYVEKSSLRKIDQRLAVIPPIAYSGVVVNSAIDVSGRQSQALIMRDSEVSRVRILKFNQEKNIYEVYLHPACVRPGGEHRGFQAR